MKKKYIKHGTFEIWGRNYLPDMAGIECSYSILGNDAIIENLRIVLEEEANERDLEIEILFNKINSNDRELMLEIETEIWEHYKSTKNGV